MELASRAPKVVIDAWAVAARILGCLPGSYCVIVFESPLTLWLFDLILKECNKFTYLDPNGECVEQCPDGFFGVGIEEPGRATLTNYV